MNEPAGQPNLTTVLVGAGLGLVVAFQTWLLRSVWNSKQSREESLQMFASFREEMLKMFEAFEARDDKRDAQQLLETTEKIDGLNNWLTRIDAKLDQLIMRQAH